MDIFSALAEPTRRHIIEVIAKRGQLSATEISDKFQITPAAISQHLKVLREARLIDMERKAQQRLYKINPKGMSELETWIQKMTQTWNNRFNALDKILESEKRKLKRSAKSNAR